VRSIEKAALWVTNGAPHGKGYSMGGPWCAPSRRFLYGWSMVRSIEKVILWVVHGALHREGYPMGDPWCTP